MSRTHPWEVSDEWWRKVQPLMPPPPSHAKRTHCWINRSRRLLVRLSRRKGKITWHSFIWPLLNSFLLKPWFSDTLLVPFCFVILSTLVVSSLVLFCFVILSGAKDLLSQPRCFVALSMTILSVILSASEASRPLLHTPPQPCPSPNFIANE